MKQLFSFLPLIALVIFVQLLTGWTDTKFYLTQLTMSAYYTLLIIGLCILMGYAGQISIGHAGFFAIGGYISAALTTRNLVGFAEIGVVKMLDSLGIMVRGQDIYGEALMVIAPWAACLVAVISAGLVAWILGIPILKLKGHYLAMATLGFGVIIYRIVLASEYFGEADGISEVPPFPLFAGLEVSGDFGTRVENYYLAWGLLIAGMILLRNLIQSRAGRALRSIHSSADAAESVGVDTSRYKLKVFVLSAVFAAAAGVFLTHYNGGIGPSEAGVMKSVRYVAIVAVGGMANLWGALMMGVVLNFLSLRGVFGTYDDAVFGAILILIMLFAPKGILSLNWKELLSKLARGKQQQGVEER